MFVFPIHTIYKGLKEFCTNNQIIANLKALGFFWYRSAVWSFRPNRISECDHYQQQKVQEVLQQQLPKPLGVFYKILVFHSRYLPSKSKNNQILTINFFLFSCCKYIKGTSAFGLFFTLLSGKYLTAFFHNEDNLSWFSSPCYPLKQKTVLKSTAPNIISSDFRRKDNKHNPAIFSEILNSPYLWTIARNKFSIQL